LGWQYVDVELNVEYVKLENERIREERGKGDWLNP
jgi:DNA modification methylase